MKREEEIKTERKKEEHKHQHHRSHMKSHKRKQSRSTSVRAVTICDLKYLNFSHLHVYIIYVHIDNSSLCGNVQVYSGSEDEGASRERGKSHKHSRKYRPHSPSSDSSHSSESEHGTKKKKRKKVESHHFSSLHV